MTKKSSTLEVFLVLKKSPISVRIELETTQHSKGNTLLIETLMLVDVLRRPFKT